MKKHIKCYLCLLVCFISLSFSWFSFGYEKQGFSYYNEWVDWISFNCVNVCAIALWQKKEIDYLYLSWILNWNGVIWYGSYVWNDFSFLSQYKLNKSSNISKFADLMSYNRQIHSKSRDLVLLISGNVQWNLYLQTWNLSFLQKISLAWNNFWEMESFDQYGLNLRYGVYIRWISIVVYWYVIFILISLGVIVLNRWKQKNKLIFYIWLWLFLLIWIRNTVTYTISLNEWLNWFKTDKTYFIFWDYFSFVDKVRNKLGLDSKEYKKNNCKISLEYDMDVNYWPVDIYFKPCELASTWDFLDYKIYYKKGIPVEDLDKKVLLNISGSYLLENKSR